MTKTCPLCRAERGCNETMILRGLSEFMEAVQRIYRDEGESGRSQPIQEHEEQHP